MVAYRFLLVPLVVACFGLSAFGDDRAPPEAALEAMRRSVDERLSPESRTTDFAVWVGGLEGRPWINRDAAAVMPTASAIKTFYLVEFFVANADRLDLPLPGALGILKDDHPSISHFPPAVRDEIRTTLGQATVRRIAEIMQGKTDVPNSVYNAAANLVTAHLGGPESLTKLIHQRDLRFASVIVRRYMLRDRKQPGDNEATAEAFAALYRGLASRRLKGVTEPVMTALHSVLERGSSGGDRLYEKDGGLSTDPMTSVKAGWRQSKGGPIIFVVMARQPTVEQAQRTARYDELRAFTTAIRDHALAVASQALPAE